MGSYKPVKFNRFLWTRLKNWTFAGVAQLAEQLICNQQVVGSIPITSSNKKGLTNRIKIIIFVNEEIDAAE